MATQSIGSMRSGGTDGVAIQSCISCSLYLLCVCVCVCLCCAVIELSIEL